MIAHIGFAVRDIEKTKEMYVQALEPLGMSIQMEGHGYVGFGKDGDNYFWVGSTNDQHPVAPTDIHVCFNASSRAAVDAFYKAGIEAGFKDNGAPGIRELYSPTYYAAFMFDNDGNNIEAGCHVA